ncbi:MAG: lysoplasmalogenase family protein [Candidatus Limnocylindrales bacterium]
MTTPVVVALAVAGLAAAVDWIAVARGDGVLERIAKPAVMVGLLAAVLLAGPGTAPVRWLLVLALAASLAGDWLLIPPGRFVAGLVAFLVAHVAYLAIFLLGRLEVGGALAGLMLAGVLLLTAGRTILAGARRARLAAPVAAYFAAICAMAIAATASGSVPAVAGAWLFVASDTLLGWVRFVDRRADESPAPRVAVIVPYHLRQGLLAIAILGIGA